MQSGESKDSLTIYPIIQLSGTITQKWEHKRARLNPTCDTVLLKFFPSVFRLFIVLVISLLMLSLLSLLLLLLLLLWLPNRIIHNSNFIWHRFRQIISQATYNELTDRPAALYLPHHTTNVTNQTANNSCGLNNDHKTGWVNELNRTESSIEWLDGWLCP